MKFKSRLVPGTLMQRYKRFLADVKLDNGEIITATCPNTGSMLGLCTPGMRVWLSESDSPTRKYRHTWELVDAPVGGKQNLVGINTGHPNALVSAAIAAGAVPELAGFETLKREVKYGESSRVDILLSDPIRGQFYVEIKNVHLSREPGLAEFPDSRTERGVKHLHELLARVEAGDRAMMLYLIQRRDAERFTIAADIDPLYASAFTIARAGGVEVLALKCKISPTGIDIEGPVEIVEPAPIAILPKPGKRKSRA